MTRRFCQDHSDILTLDATVIGARPGAVRLSRHPFYPGGGGNDVLARDLAVAASDLPLSAAHAEKGLLRSRSVTPPPSPEGLVRIVEIAGLDRQACGGTHLDSTGASRPIRILKIENKGRSNRRVRIGLQER
jgi:Ser-tRNA(Ala) deacylase AlaX